MHERSKDQRQAMWRWTRAIAGLFLAVRFANLMFVVLLAALAANFDLMIVVLLTIVMFMAIVVHLTQWRRRRDG